MTLFLGLLVAVLFVLIFFSHWGRKTMKTIMHQLRNSSRRNVGDAPPAFRPSMVGLPLNIYIYIYVYISLRWGNRRLYKLLFLLFFRFLVFSARDQLQYIILTTEIMFCCLQEVMHVLSQSPYCRSWLKSCLSV